MTGPPRIAMRLLDRLRDMGHACRYCLPALVIAVTACLLVTGFYYAARAYPVVVVLGGIGWWCWQVVYRRYRGLQQDVRAQAQAEAQPEAQA